MTARNDSPTPAAWVCELDSPQPRCVTDLRYRTWAEWKAGVEYIPLFTHPPQWPQPRPMSEAPKQADAWPPEKILAWWPDSKEGVATWWWTARGIWIHALSEYDEHQPTHWLPMPPAPTEQEVSK